MSWSTAMDFDTTMNWRFLKKSQPFLKDGAHIAHFSKPKTNKIFMTVIWQDIFLTLTVLFMYSSYHQFTGSLYGWLKEWYALMLGKKAVETWCGELHQLRKFLFFYHQWELQGKERLVFWFGWRAELKQVNIAERASLTFRSRQKVEMK